MKSLKESNSVKKSSGYIFYGLKSIPVYLPTFIACIIIIIISILKEENASKQSTFMYLLLLLSQFLFCLSGILSIIRREIPRLGLPSIKGLSAIIIGIMVVIVTSFSMLLLLIEMVK